MTFVNNVKRGFRRSCVIIAFFAMCFLVGCGGTQLTTRAYPLGWCPKATEAIVNEIVVDEARKHLDGYQQQSGQFLTKSFPEEKLLVVKTTPEGHRQIEASLKHLEGQLDAPRED
jgi:hypothetical protein